MATQPIAKQARSGGVSYQQLLDIDTHPVPDVLRWESPIDLPPSRVPVEQYTSREYHDLEVEKKRLRGRLAKEVAVRQKAS